MAINYIKHKGYYKVSYSMRHPKTRHPVGLSRTHFKDGGGKKKPITTLVQAQRVEKHLVMELNERVLRLKTPSWDTLLQQFQVYYLSTGVMQKTVDTYMCCLLKHTKTCKNLRCDEVTGVMIREIINNVGKSSSVSHQKNVLKFIRKVFDYAVEAGYLQINPTPDMKFRIGDKNARVLKTEEIKRLLNAAKASNCEWYPHWVMALYTGLRNGELYALKWEHIDLDSRLIHVKQSWNKIDGFKCTKSGDERIVPIAEDLLTLLRELKITGHDPEFVLPRHYLWDKGEQARMLQTFLMGINITPVRFHDLRATWATQLLSNGVEPVKVMSMGGWKEMKTMMIYIRKAGIDIKGSTECLSFHNPKEETGQVLPMKKNDCSNL